MGRGRAVWKLLNREAEKLRRLAARMRGERAQVMRLGVLVIESLADKALSGEITPDDLDRLSDLLVLFRLHALPTEPVLRVREMLSMNSSIRYNSMFVSLGNGIVTLA